MKLGIADSIECRNCSINNGYIYQKRILDVILSCAALVVLSVPMLIIVLLIKLEDNTGSAIYAHERIGKYGKKIKCYKFRSMYHNSKELFDHFTDEQKREYEESFKLLNDPRITKIGYFLRRTSLDELPQLLNIIKGEMSIVGPRPIVERELTKYKESKDIYLSIRPGLTGLWQVSGRSDTTYDERVALDVEYVNRRCLSLDIAIIFKTVYVVLCEKGAF